MDIFIRRVGHAPKRPSLKELTAKSKFILKVLELDNVELSIYITDDDEMKRLNRIYRNIDKSTNVLAFPLEDLPSKQGSKVVILGDVVISFETAKQEAKSESILYSDKLYQLIIHGIVHLAGYDHEISEAEFMQSMELENRLFAKVKERFRKNIFKATH
ncbi:MAG: rRNA maturation RNase YbeY [Nitrospinota bacterium]